MQVFLSYSRTDAQWVEMLAAELARRGLVAWVDQRELPVALPWLEEVRSAIEESSIFVSCTSESFWRSPNCAAEREAARSTAATVVEVDASGDVDTAAGAIVGAARSRTLEQEQAIELTVRARAWDARDRPRQGLLGSRDYKRLHRVTVLDDQRRQLVGEFLKKSRRRRRQRRLVTTAGVSMLLLALFGREAFELAQEELEAQSLEANQTIARASIIRQQLDRDVYDGLRYLAAAGDTESALVAASFSASTTMLTPTDAFRVSSGRLVRFGSDTVDAEVFVLTSDGAGWSRRTEEAGSSPVRSANGAESAAEVVPTAVVAAGSVSFTTAAGTVRTVVPGPEVTRAALSPDGRMVAALHDHGGLVIDAETGREVATLRGAPSELADIAWSSDSSDVWALGGDLVVKWDVREGRRLIDDPGRRFRSLLPSPNPREVWILEESGELLLVSVQSGDTVRRFQLPGRALHAVGEPGHEFAAVVGIDEVYIADLKSGAVETLDLRCSYSEPAVDQAGRFLINCESIVVVDPATARVVEEWERPASAAGEPLVADEVSGGVWIPAPFGLISVNEESNQFVEDRDRAPCIAASNAASLSTRYMVLSGQGSGSIACPAFRRREGTSLIRQPMAWDIDSTRRSRTAEISPDETFVVSGFGDGSVTYWPTENLTPQRRVIAASGDVFDLLLVGDEILVATRGGVLHAIELPEEAPSNAAMAQEAAERLDVAQVLGLLTE